MGMAQTLIQRSAPMSCCDENLASVPKGINSSKDVAAPDVSRRSVLKGAAAIAGVLSSAGPAAAQTNLKPVKLAYCSQILCGVPYEVAKSGRLLAQTGSRRRIDLHARRQCCDAGPHRRRRRLRRNRARCCDPGLFEGRGNQTLRGHRPSAAVRADYRAEKRGQRSRPSKISKAKPSACLRSVTPITRSCSFF